MSALPPDGGGSTGDVTGPTTDGVSHETPDDPTGKRRGETKTHHTVAKAVGATMVVIALVTGLTVVFLYRHYNANLNVKDITGELGTQRPTHPAPKGPHGPINIMIMGSDNRDA